MKNNPLPADDNLIFALDIGTRSVIGILGRRQGELFRIEAMERIEHHRRAMIDGQIEDIEQVARVAKQIKQRLENTIGATLHRVSVAAAGRALKTCRASAKISIQGAAVTHQLIYELENSAVNAAHLTLDEDTGHHDETHYFCAGHSVVQYLIDGYPFANILDHKGTTAQVEIIATFLPTEVVNSLRRCTEILGLTIDTLTLEPIAAMRAVLPADVRLLNLALIDIGAGTSDIALSREGAVSGYTMATMAGDEVTEAIIRKFLVDFETAETMKLALSGGESIPYTDILGFEYTKEPQEILQAIELTVDMLAQVISDRLLECNDGPPTGVFLVGGASMTPGLPAALSEKLGMEENRVAIAGTRFVGRVLAEEGDEGAICPQGPEYATPVGIALLAMDNAGAGGMAVRVNGRLVRLFTQQKSSVMQALLLAGYHYSDLMGRNGRSITFTLNGTRKVARGGAYTIAEIQLNGLPASLSTPLQNNAAIEIQPATSGKDAAVTIAHYAGDETAFSVTLNGAQAGAGLIAFINGSPVGINAPIHEQDQVQISHIHTASQLCRAAGLFVGDASSLSINGETAEENTPLHPGDSVALGATPSPTPSHPAKKPLPQPAISAPEKPSPLPPTAPRPQADLERSQKADAETALFPPASFQSETPKMTPFTNGSKKEHVKTTMQTDAPIRIVEIDAKKHTEEKNTPSLAGGGSLRILLNGRTLVLPPKPDGEPHLLLDLLPLLDIDPKKPQGTIRLRHNNAEGAYAALLRSNDELEIGWEKNNALL